MISVVGSRQDFNQFWIASDQADDTFEFRSYRFKSKVKFETRMIRYDCGHYAVGISSLYLNFTSQVLTRTSQMLLKERPLVFRILAMLSMAGFGRTMDGESVNA